MNSEELDWARLTLLGAERGCPYVGRIPEDCPLTTLNQLPLDKRGAQIFNMSEQLACQLACHHYNCSKCTSPSDQNLRSVNSE